MTVASAVAFGLAVAPDAGATGELVDEAVPDGEAVAEGVADGVAEGVAEEVADGVVDGVAEGVVEGVADADGEAVASADVGSGDGVAPVVVASAAGVVSACAPGAANSTTAKLLAPRAAACVARRPIERCERTGAIVVPSLCCRRSFRNQVSGIDLGAERTQYSPGRRCTRPGGRRGLQNR